MLYLLNGGDLLMRLSLVLACVLAVVPACGGDDDDDVGCPENYELRDGYCYPPGGDGDADADADADADGDGDTDADGDADADADADGDGDADAEADGDGDVICNGTHPIVDGGSRTCQVGDTYCAATDQCFPDDVAAQCCDGGDVICNGTHPLLRDLDGDGNQGEPDVDGERYCQDGDAYCGCPGYEACFPADVSQECCDAECAG